MSASTPEAQALALFRAGRLAEAHAAWSAILARRPDDPEALHMTGYILTRLGRVDEGLALMGRSIERAPRVAAFLNNRAQVLAESGRADEAVHDLRRAVQLEPRFLDALCHLGILLQRAGRAEEALAAFRRALALDPGQPLALYNLGVLLLAKGDRAGAEQSFRHVLEREPGHGMALNNLGIVARDTGRVREAREWFTRAGASGQPASLHNLAIVLREDGDLEGAAEAWRRALAAGVRMPGVLLNAASAALDLGRLDEAEALYREALAARPGWADAEYGLGQAALRRLDFPRGWRGYERRFETDPPQAVARRWDIPRLAAEDLHAGIRVAVWREQGVGDQILFSTLLPELVERGVDALVEVDERLHALYRRSLPRVAFVAGDDDFERCDRHIAAGSLPALLRPDVESFSRQPRAMLQPDAARVQAVRERLGPGRWIAVSWRSLQRGDRRRLGERKSVPLALLAAFAQATGARLLDIQYGDVDEERAAFMREHPGVLQRLAELDAYADLEGVAAAMAACEAVVSTSNATAHLAGAIGADTRLVYLGDQPPFSYWAAGDGGRSLWYPSVRPIGGPALRTWEDVLREAADSLS